MSDSVIDIRNRLRAGRPRLSVVARSEAPVTQTVEVATPAPEIVTPAPDALIIEHPDTHRVVVTSPVHEAASRATESVLRLSGRLVRAEEANRNGALWSKGDLEFGLPTVAHGPLNYQHEMHTVIGTLLNPALVDNETAADGAQFGPYIATDAAMWRWVHPARVAEISHYLEAGQTWLSMECIAERVQCTGPVGCGQIMSYRDAALKTEAACAHVKDRASHRRMVNPTFQGAAVIIPPKTPAWADADLALRRASEEVLEAASHQVGGMSDAEAAAMVATVMSWAGRS